MLFFGGARGGGKSDFLLGDYFQDVSTHGKDWQGVFFRRTYPELEEPIRRAKEIYQGSGCTWLEQKKQFVWPNGACLRFRHCERLADVDKYQGHQYGWMAFDEITNQADEQVFRRLLACNRWAEKDLPTKRIRLSGNPGGPGHSWVKKLFIDPAPGGCELIEDGDIERMFIPSKVSDNEILMSRDPDYIRNLENLGSPELVSAWLSGDWNVILGAYFPEFTARHVIRPRPIPPYWTRFRAIDWGFHAPSAVLWIAVSDGMLEGIPEGALVVYREYYGAGLTAEELAPRIRDMTAEEVRYSVCDPSMFPQKSKVIKGPSLAEVFVQAGVNLTPGDNNRLAGWQQLRQRLRGVDGIPMLYIFDTCRELIRTLPLLQHDDKKPEDCDTTGEDHLADALRYGCMSRPFVVQAPAQEKPKVLQVGQRSTITIDEMWADAERR